MPEDDCTEKGALARVLKPTFPPEYYIDQGVKYFRSMETGVPVRVHPNYAPLVVRWEWEPWLLLTGYKKKMMKVTDVMLKLNPTAYYLLDCRFFEEQPFCRCHVVFNYSGETCPIYEEFTFNDAGEITFIEAWSDFESLLPMDPGEDGLWDESDYWAMHQTDRLATKVPGLGSADGKIALNTACMEQAALEDKDIAELVKRLEQPVKYWFKQLLGNFKMLKSGCEPPEGDVYPYYVEQP